MPPELLEAAKREARQSGVSLSSLLRDALAHYLRYLEGRPRGARRRAGR